MDSSEADSRLKAIDNLRILEYELSDLATQYRIAISNDPDVTATALEEKLPDFLEARVYPFLKQFCTGKARPSWQVLIRGWFYQGSKRALFQELRHFFKEVLCVNKEYHEYRIQVHGVVFHCHRDRAGLRLVNQRLGTQYLWL